MTKDALNDTFYTICWHSDCFMRTEIDFLMVVWMVNIPKFSVIQHQQLYKTVAYF